MRSLIVVIVILLPCPARAAVWNVPSDFQTIQEAVNFASSNDTIRVAPGSYSGSVDFRGKPLTLTGWAPTDDDIVRGTVLSRTSVGMTMAPTSNTARLVGLTITGGGPGSQSGVRATATNGAKIVIEDCRFVANRASSLGAALDINSNGNVLIRRCLFANNSSESGGAIHVTGGPVLITRCHFVGNVAESLGGALKVFGGDCTVSQCLFIGNVGNYGGAVNHTSASGYTRCHSSTFVMNRSPRGLGHAVGSSSQPRVAAVNCLFAGNGEPAVLRVDIAHCVVIQPGLTGPGLIAEEPDFVRWPSDGGDGWGDDPNTPDDEGANDDVGDLRLRAGSPGIDAGDNRAILPDFADLDNDGDANEPTPVDFDGNPRIADDPNSPDLGIGPWAVVDMGAYEFVSGTSLCREDVTGDGDVGLDDLSALLAGYAAHDGDPAYAAVIDITDDGAIDLSDLAALLSVFGEACPY